MKLDVVLASFVLVLCSAVASAVEDPKKPAAEAAKPAAGEMSAADKAVWNVQRFSYPLATCPISGEKLGEKRVEFVTKGRLVRTCCNDCRGPVEKDPTAAFAKIDAAVVAAQKPSYPLDTCAITGEKLGDKALDRVVGTKLVRVANADAAAKLDADPKAALAKVDEGYIKAQLAAYPLKSCPVTGEALGTPEMGEPVNKVYGTQLVRLCCAGCIKTFEKKSDEYLAKIAAAGKPAKAGN